MKEEVILKHILNESKRTNRLIRKNNELLLQLIAEIKRRNQFWDSCLRFVQVVRKSSGLRLESNNSRKKMNDTKWCSWICVTSMTNSKGSWKTSFKTP